MGFGNDLWRCSSEAGLLLEDWGSEVSVLDRATGETYLFDALTAEVLTLITEGPRTLRQLAGGLAAACGVPHDDAWEGRIAEILRGLSAVELVEPNADRLPDPAL